MGVFGEVYINDVFVRGYKIVREVKKVIGTEDSYLYHYEYWSPEWSYRLEGAVLHIRSQGLEKLTVKVMEDVYEQIQALASG